MAQQLNQYVGEARLLGINMVAGNGNPTISAKKGSLYIKLDASGTTDRLWINTDGATTWTFFTSNA